MMISARGKNNGMMEYWNDDLKKMTFLYLIPVNRNFTITQLYIFPEPSIPVFHCSIIPIVSTSFLSINSANLLVYSACSIRKLM